MNWKRIAVNEEASVEIDDSARQKLKTMSEECRGKYREMMSDENAFRVFGYEGQTLRNFWNDMAWFIECLVNGKVTKDTIKAFDNALSVIYYPDRHKIPGPTDPRDVR